MTIGLKEAQQMGPMPKPISPYDSQPDIIDYSAQKAKIGGPVDPLVGPTSPDDISGLVTSANRVIALLEKIMIATRAVKPNTPLAILGNPNIGANAGEVYNFEMDGRPVPALAVFIFNNSGHTIFIGLDDPPGSEGLPIANGAQLAFNLAAVHKLGIFCTNASVVNGVVNTNVKSLTGINIYAWGNSEYANVWGMAS